MTLLGALRRGQGSPEFTTVTSFVFLVFLVVFIIASQKQSEAHESQVFLDAKKVARSFATNINTIARNGHGYYRYFSLPSKLHAETKYNLTISGNFLSISYGNINWATPLISEDVTIISINKTQAGSNCVYNNRGSVAVNISCRDAFT